MNDVANNGQAAYVDMSKDRRCLLIFRHDGRNYVSIYANRELAFDKMCRCMKQIPEWKTMGCDKFYKEHHREDGTCLMNGVFGISESGAWLKDPGHYGFEYDIVPLDSIGPVVIDLGEEKPRIEGGWDHYMPLNDPRLQGVPAESVPCGGTADLYDLTVYYQIFDNGQAGVTSRAFYEINGVDEYGEDKVTNDVLEILFENGFQGTVNPYFMMGVRSEEELVKLLSDRGYVPVKYDME